MFQSLIGLPGLPGLVQGVRGQGAKLFDRPFQDLGQDLEGTGPVQVGQGIGVGPGNGGGLVEDEGVQAVHRIGGCVVVAVRPLAQHGGGDPDGGVGQDLVVATGREVAQEEIEHGNLIGGVEVGDITLDFIVTKGRHIGDNRGCGVRLGPQGQGTVARGLAATHHVQVEAGQDPVGPVVFVGQPGVGAGELRHKDDPDAPLERWEIIGVQEPLEHP